MSRPVDIVPYKPEIIVKVIRFVLPLALAVLLTFASATGGSGNPTARMVPSGLDQLVGSYAAPVEKALKSLKLGVDDFQSEKYAAALKDLPDEALAAATLVGDYALLYRAKAGLALEQSDEPLRLFRLLRTRYPGSPLLQQAILGECQALLKQHQPEAALALLQGTRLEDSADVEFTRAQSLDQSGKRPEALALYLRVYAKYTNSAAASLAEKRLKAIAPAFETNPKNYSSMLERADNLSRAGRNRDARTVLLRLAKVKAPDSAAGTRRKVFWARVEYNLGRGAALIPLLEKTSAAEPATRAESIYILGLCYRRAAKEESFFTARDRLLSLYPQSPFAQRLLYASAGYLDLDNRLEAAGQAFGMVAERYPKGEYAERALWRSCIFLYFQKRYEEALRGFWHYHTDWPDLRYAAPALYWMGRCYEKLGDGAHAAYLYGCCSEFSAENYYGQRAREGERAVKQSGLVPGKPASAVDFAHVKQWADALHRPDLAIPEPESAARSVLERSRQLMTADLPDLALAELRSAQRKYPDTRAIPYMMARVYEQKDSLDDVIRSLRRAFPYYDTRPLSALPQEVWKMLYPLRHDTEIGAAAARYGVDPDLVRAIIRQESAFDEDARSSANARGLMQVLPSTGKSLARQAGIRRYTVRNLYRPDVNIALGTRFLAGLLNEYEHRVEVALAAYNAGTDRAERWLSEFGITDPAEFVERVPFAETRDYIKQVVTNAAYYRLISTVSNAENR